MPHKLPLTVALLLLFCSTIIAHPGHDGAANLRVWKAADGGFKIDASFVLVKEEQVQLRKHDGELVWIPMAKLSTGDRDWIQNRLCEIRRLNAVVVPGTWPEEPTESVKGARDLSVAGEFTVCVAVFVPLLLILRCGNPAKVTVDSHGNGWFFDGSCGCLYSRRKQKLTCHSEAL